MKKFDRSSVFFLSISMLFSFELSSQQRVLNKTNEASLFAVNLSLGYQGTAGWMANDFKPGLSVGGETEVILWPSNIIFGANGWYRFGGSPKNDVLANIRTDDGRLIAGSFSVASELVQTRALLVGGHIGKLWAIHPNNKRSGIRAQIGGGYFRRWLFIDTRGSTIPGIDQEGYKKGYDRSTGGLALQQSIGYQYFQKKRRINFFAMVDFTQAFSQPLRSWDFATLQPPKAEGIDFIYGFRLGWTLPVYFGDKGENIEY
jgi:hypothetical protein